MGAPNCGDIHLYSPAGRDPFVQRSVPPLSWRRTELAGVLVADGAALTALGMEICEERPGLARPASVSERVVAVLLLVGQLRIAELDRPLLDVEAELRIVERQLLETAEEPHERDPVVGREIAPEHGMLVVIGEDAERN